MDIDKEAGGVYKLISKKLTVDITDGKIVVSSSNIDRAEKMTRHGYGNNRSSDVRIQAVKVKDSSGKEVAMWAGDRELTHRDGTVYQERFPNKAKALEQMRSLVREQGKRLVLWPESSDVLQRLLGPAMGDLIRNVSG